MSHVKCDFCGFFCYETSTYGTYKCSGCGEVFNLNEEEEEDD